MTHFFSDFHFIRPFWLLGIPLAVGIWWLWRSRSSPLRGWREQMDPDLLDALVVSDVGARDRSPVWLLIGWLTAVLAIAGPTWKREPNPFAAEAQPLFLLLKASDSMDLEDLAPSRLERAQLKIADLCTLRPGQPLGLVAYAGSAHLVLPPTRDAGIVGNMASEISPEIMPRPGDRLDLAIRRVRRLLEDSFTGGTLLIVADSIGGDLAQLTEAWRSAGSPPTQILAMAPPNSPERESLRTTARALRATVHEWTPDDQDVAAIARWANRQPAGGIAGETSRWQEAGYALTPLLALLMALSFRRQKSASEGRS